MPLDLTLDLADSGSAADWVKKSREGRGQGQVQQNREERMTGKTSNASSGHGSKYSSKELSGMQIMHDSTAFEVGEEVVLTLADTDVVTRDEYGRVVDVNDGDDALENVNIAEGERKEDRDKRLKRLRQPIYNGFDDDEFDEDTQVMKKPNILSQYDQEKKRSAKMVIGDGIVTSLGTGTLKTTTSDKPAFQSLRTEFKMANDFVDASEIKFKKVKKADGDKKRKKIREKSPEPESATNKDNDDYDLSKILGEETDEVNPAPATTAEGETKTVDGRISNGAGRESYEDTEKKPLLSSLLKNKKRKINFFSTQLAQSSSVVYEDEDPDLALAMSRARQSAISARRKDPTAMEEDNDDEEKQQQQQQQNRRIADDEDNDRGAKFARDMALKAAAQMAQDKGAAESKMGEESAYAAGDIFGEEDINVDGRRADGKLVFNSTTEFASRLQARLTDRARLTSEAAVRDMERGIMGAGMATATTTAVAGTAAVNNEHQLPLGTHSAAKNNDEEEGEDKMDDENGDNDNDQNSTEDADFIMDMEEADNDDGSNEENDDDIDDEQMAFLHKQPLFSKGLGATLALLKGAGELNKPTQLAGRAKDFRDQETEKDFSGIRLEYRDEYGNKLTKKEEFRRMSYQFHGQGPGKKKLEKRMKAQKALLRAGLPKSGVLDGTAGTMKSLNRTLEATGKSHVMLQGGVTSDTGTITILAQELMKKKEQKEKKKEKEGSSKGNTSSNKK